MASSGDLRRAATVLFVFAGMLQLPALLVLEPRLGGLSRGNPFARAASWLIDAPVAYVCLYAPFRICPGSPTIDSIRPALWASLIFTAVGLALDRRAAREDGTDF